MSVDLNFSLIEKSKVREIEEKRSKERKINILVLIKQYLQDEGYADSLSTLESETHLSECYSLCDNIDLNSILRDFESFHYMRFQKYPKISKKVESAQCPNQVAQQRKAVKKPKRLVKEAKTLGAGDEISSEQKGEPSSLIVSPLCQVDTSCSNRLWRGMGNYEGYSNEWKILADIIAKEVIECNLNTSWDDVIGLDGAKQLLKEAIVYPTKYPNLFQGILSPWKGLLLYGPPGTGKTLLAKAVATECNTTFFNISASSIVSKWRGDSEKLVRVMFELARIQAPSTIFIDELDSLASRRDCPTEHEASRRLKSELLVQLDGLLQCNKNVFLLTTSNLPWDLDPAILRRLEKHIFVDLPQGESRVKLFERYLPANLDTTFKIRVEVDYYGLADASEGYSGSDIKLVCKETVMEAMRPLFPVLSDGPELSNRLKKMNPITSSDVLQAMKRSARKIPDTVKFKQWVFKRNTQD